MHLCQREPSQRRYLALTTESLVSFFGCCGISESGRDQSLWEDGRNRPFLLLFFVQVTQRPSLYAPLWRKPWPTHEGQPKTKDDWRWLKDLLYLPAHVWVSGFQLGLWQRYECPSMKCVVTNGWEVPTLLLNHVICLAYARNIFFCVSREMGSQVTNVMLVEAVQAK